MTDEVECPICSQRFSVETIERHVDKCLVSPVVKPVTRGRNKPLNFFSKKSTKRKKDINSPLDECKKTKQNDVASIIIDEQENKHENVSQLDINNTGNSQFEVRETEKDISILQKECEENKKEEIFSIPSPTSCDMKSVSLCRDAIEYAALPSPPDINDINETSELIDLADTLENVKGGSENYPTDISLSIEKCDEESLRNQVDQQTDHFSPNGVKKSGKYIENMTSSNLDNQCESFNSESIESRTSTKKKTSDNITKSDFPKKVSDISKSPLNNFQQELFKIATSGANNAFSPTVAKTNHGKSKRMKSTPGEKDRPLVEKKEIVLGKLPLAEQMRPRSLDDYVGQDALSAQKLLKELFYNDLIPSMILWGPPGCGKTSLAHIISQQCKSGQRYRFISLSATMSGVNDVKDAVKIAKNERRLTHKHTVLFIDEVHRFNKIQQDSFLPHIEDGTIVFIGATTENPSFHLNNALISRCRLVILNELTVENVENILRNAVVRLHGVDASKKVAVSGEHRFTLEDGVIKLLAENSNGDARVALTSLDMILQSKVLGKGNNKPGSLPSVSCEQVKRELKRGHISYDRNGEDHYNMISAFHKSIRGGDENATVYWLARMLEGGEEPLYIARRMIRIASEDIGMGDPTALNLAVSAFQACQFIGMPECDVVLAQAATYLSKAPKSIAVYEAYNEAKKLIKEYSGPQPLVPFHLRNAPTKLMKNLGYSKDYKYTPKCRDDPHQDYLPEDIVGTAFFK